MMLRLLSTFDAALICYCVYEAKKEWKLSFTPEIKSSLQDTNVMRDVLMYQTFLENAIKANEVPALKKAKGRPADKKIFNKLEIPKEYQEILAQYDYFVTLEDLFTFLERPNSLPSEYAHGRDALARLLCAMIDNKELAKVDLTNLNELLAQKIESIEAELNVSLNLGEITLNGCCREILETYSTFKNNKTEK
jgi:hypothetical protein